MAIHDSDLSSAIAHERSSTSPGIGLQPSLPRKCSSFHPVQLMGDHPEVDREEVRALAVRMITPTLALRRSEDLIALARQWDRELGTTRPQSELGDALARALLEMHRVVDQRLSARYLREPLPSFARGPIGSHASASPLDQLIEDVAPFGNVDVWRTYLRDPAPPRMRRRRRPTPPPTPPPERQPAPQFRRPRPVGLSGFDNLGQRGRVPHGVVSGPVSALIPAPVNTGVEFTTSLILEITEATIGPLIGGIITFVGVLDTFEGTRRTQARAARVWGIRLSLMALSLVIEDVTHGPPVSVSRDQLHQFIMQTRDLRQQWDNQHIALPEVPVERLMMESVAETARTYNQAMRSSLQRFDEEARRTGYSPTPADLREFRLLVGRKLIESAQNRLEAP